MILLKNSMNGTTKLEVGKVVSPELRDFFRAI
jgi:hypothetical protein